MVSLYFRDKSSGNTINQSINLITVIVQRWFFHLGGQSLTDTDTHITRLKKPKLYDHEIHFPGYQEKNITIPNIVITIAPITDKEQ